MLSLGIVMVFKIRGNRACVRAFLSRRQFHCKRESQHDVNGCVKCVADCIIRRVVPQPTERQDIRNQIDSELIFRRADFVCVRNLLLLNRHFGSLNYSKNLIAFFEVHSLN